MGRWPRGPARRPVYGAVGAWHRAGDVCCASRDQGTARQTIRRFHRQRHVLERRCRWLIGTGVTTSARRRAGWRWCSGRGCGGGPGALPGLHRALRRARQTPMRHPARARHHPGPERPTDLNTLAADQGTQARHPHGHPWHPHPPRWFVEECRRTSVCPLRRLNVTVPTQTPSARPGSAICVSRS